MWPTTPIVHMVYRFWQLARGSQLISELGGPGLALLPAGADQHYFFVCC